MSSYYGQPQPGVPPFSAAAKQPPLYYSATGGTAYSDLESGQQALFPGITIVDQNLRWGFIQKVRKLASLSAKCSPI